MALLAGAGVRAGELGAPHLSRSEGTLVLSASVPERLFCFKRPIKMPINIKEGVHPQNTVWGDGAAVRVATCSPGCARCRPQRWPTGTAEPSPDYFTNSCPCVNSVIKAKREKAKTRT